MAKVYGIDLGTTYCAIATLDDNGMPEVIENFTDSIPLLASAVYFPESGDPVIGKEAKNQAEVEPDRVVQYVKREIGKPDAHVYEFNGVKYDPILVSALILKRMKEYANEQGHEVNDAVITCPAYFGTEERNATRQAGVLAGLNVLNIVNEPTAAALNYCSREFQESRKIMVYDLGGGTFDITLIDYSVDESGKASIDVIKTGGDDQLGGIDWVARLNDYICDQYTNENGVARDEMDSELRQKIRAQVEDIKKSLSAMPKKSCTLNYAGDTTRLEITRDKFEELTQDLVVRTMDFVRKLLSEASISASDVDVVLLVGGSTRMPMIKTAVQSLFPGEVRVEDPDLAVAKGAAIAAAVEFNEHLRNYIENEDVVAAGGKVSELEHTSPNMFNKDQTPITKDKAMGLMIRVPEIFSGDDIVKDKLSRSFGPGIILSNEQNKFAIDNLLFIDDASPSEASETYYTLMDNQSAIQIYIFENIADDRVNKYVTPCQDMDGVEQYSDPALKVKSIGRLELELPPNTPIESPIEIMFRSSTIGLEVRARNPATNQSVETVITSANTKTKEEMAEATSHLASLRTSGQI